MNSGRDVISKVKNGKWTAVVYMTYVLNFPDGEQWVKQTPFNAHSLEMEIRNMIKEHAKQKGGRAHEWKNRAMALWKVGECWWKDSLNVEHLILIENKKRPSTQLRWGVSKKGMSEIKHGLTEDPWAKKLITE